MARHTPTLLECHEWVLEHCTNLLNDSVTTTTTTGDEEQVVVDQRLEDCLMAIESTRIFVNALDSPLTLTRQWIQQLDALTLTLQRATTLTNTIGIVVQEIESICAACKPWLHPVSYVKCQSLSGPSASKYKREDPRVIPRLTPSHYASMWPEPYNCDTGWFRQYFVGNPYITLIGPPPQPNATGRTAASLDRSDPSLSHQNQHSPVEDDGNINSNDEGLSSAIISVVQEVIEAPSLPPSSIHDNDEETPPQPPSPGIHYRLIIRKKKETLRYVLSDTTIQNTLTCLEALGQIDRLEPSSSSSAHLKKQKQKRRPLRSFSSAIIQHTGTHLTSLPSTSSALPHEHEDDNDDNDTDTESTTCHQNNHSHHHRRQISHRKYYLSHRLLHAAVLSVYHHLDLRNFKALSAESTILAGLEKELLRFDEMEASWKMDRHQLTERRLIVPRNYKFGLLTVQDDQTCEEKWLSNTGLSDDLEAFLNIIGQRISLQHYKGYAAGLDTKCGESGKYSYVTSWKDHEVMFHVGPLMPYNAQDKQQVHRKRYIGNDIVCLVFMDTNQPRLFDPGSIRSQFLHVFIVVHLEKVDGRKGWRVEVLSNKNVAPFGPLIPSPPLFFVERELREFLLLKLVSAENAALQSDKFAIPNAKARQGIFKTLVDMGLAAPTHSLTSSNSFLRSKTGGLDGYLAMIGGSGPCQHDGKTSKTSDNSGNNNSGTPGINHRPKSAGPGGRCYSRTSLRSLRAALDISAPSLPFKSSTSSTSLICCSSPSSSTSSSSSLSFVMAKRSLTPEPPNASTPTSSSSSSILFPYSSRSNMLRDLKNLTRRRHSTASTSGATTLLVNRTPTPSSMVERPFRTNSPPCLPCDSPTLMSEARHVESPISWTDEEDGAESPSHPSPPPTSLLTARSHSSSSLTNTNNRSTMPPSATASSAYYSSPPSPPPTLDMMQWVGSGEQNQTIRSRAHHLMSAVMRRKQQTTLANSSSSSVISRMSRSKSSYVKD